MRKNIQSRLASSKAIFEAGPIVLLNVVFNFTTQTTSFKPPYVSKTPPIGQCDRGIYSITTITRSQTLKTRRIVKMVNTQPIFSRTFQLQSELMHTSFLSLLRVLCNFQDSDLVILLQSANSWKLMARSQIYHYWSRLKDIHLNLLPFRKEMFGVFFP